VSQRLGRARPSHYEITTHHAADQRDRGARYRQAPPPDRAGCHGCRRRRLYALCFAPDCKTQGEAGFVVSEVTNDLADIVPEAAMASRSRLPLAGARVRSARRRGTKSAAYPASCAPGPPVAGLADVPVRQHWDRERHAVRSWGSPAELLDSRPDVTQVESRVAQPLLLLIVHQRRKSQSAGSLIHLAAKQG